MNIRIARYRIAYRPMNAKKDVSMYYEYAHTRGAAIQHADAVSINVQRDSWITVEEVHVNSEGSLDHHETIALVRGLA